MSSLALVLVLLVPQDSRARDDDLAAFAALPALKKAAITRRIESRLAQDPDPLLRRIAKLPIGAGEYPEVEPVMLHDPDEWAKGVAPARELVPAGSVAHRTAREAFPRVPFLDDLHAFVVYDWSRARVAHRATPLSFDERFANYAHGWPPGADEAVALVLAELDADPKQHALASYLGHAWADLDAHAFEGITLYEAWYSGKRIDVPDVDAIPFAVQILGDRSYVSPIPNDRRREALYERIKTHAFRHRLYRTLREAAAAAFVRAEPVIEETYVPLVPRFHLTWAELHDDVAAMKELVTKMPDRDLWITKLDRRVKDDPAVFERREARKRELAASAEHVREIALEELHRDH